MSYYGVAFEPYVGPWVGGQPVLFNGYSLADVTALLQAIAPSFNRIATFLGWLDPKTRAKLGSTALRIESAVIEEGRSAPRSASRSRRERVELCSCVIRH